MIANLIAELNRRYERWSFIGDMAKWQQTGGQWLVRRFEVVTPNVDDNFVFGGRRIYVRQGEPTGDNPQMPLPVNPLVAPVRRTTTEPLPVGPCPHRSLEQIDTIRCDQCGQGKGQMKPVYACAIHGRCTHRLERRGQQSQEVPTWVCVGCKDGPWAPV